MSPPFLLGFKVGLVWSQLNINHTSETDVIHIKHSSDTHTLCG
jgi:hypothetical protein